MKGAIKWALEFIIGGIAAAFLIYFAVLLIKGWTEGWKDVKMKQALNNFVTCIKMQKECYITLLPDYDVYFDKDGKWIALVKYVKSDNTKTPKVIQNITFVKPISFDIDKNKIEKLFDIYDAWTDSCTENKDKDYYLYTCYNPFCTYYLIGTCMKAGMNYYKCYIGNFYPLRLFVNKGSCSDYFDKKARYIFRVTAQKIILEEVQTQ